MSRRCPVTGKGVQTGNHVSHAHNKRRRRFEPNLHKVSLLSEALGRKVPMTVSTHCLRTIEVKGGLDAWLTGTSNARLTEEALTLKRQVQRAAKKAG